MKVLLLLLFSTTSFASPFVQSVARQELIAHGKMAYLNRCAGCHGEKGDGLGPAAKFLDPKPRDFTTGIFKFRSSPLGTLPSDHDLMNTISRGIPNSSMPSFADVPEQERFAIVEYVKTFSPVWNDSANFAPAVIGAAFPEEDFKDFSKKATNDLASSNQIKANEHTEVNTPTKPTPPEAPKPETDKKDKGVQPDHNTSKPKS